jgi:hypothetical protein
MIYSEAQSTTVEVTGDYINRTVSHFIELNTLFGLDTISLGNLRCVLKQKDTGAKELYISDNFHKIRVFVPLSRHIEKMHYTDNFNDIMCLNNTIVELKDVMLDFMVSKHESDYFCNLVLYAQDYEVVGNDVGRSSGQLFIDELDVFTGFVSLKRDDLLKLIGSNECQKSVLILNKIETYKTQNIGKIKICLDRQQYNTERKSGSIGKVETYSIKSQSYKKSISKDIDFYVIDGNM